MLTAKTSLALLHALNVYSVCSFLDACRPASEHRAPYFGALAA